MANVPPLVDATVLSQAPDGYGLIVSVDWFGGQIPALPVQVLTHGPRDAVRGYHPPLPAPGTRGVVAFTRGDDRTGRWIGASSPALPDASTMTPGFGNVDYQAEFGGGWSWLGPDGTRAGVMADGSSFLLGAAMPSPTRHTVNAAGQRVSTPFSASERVPSPPSAFQATLDLASGLSLAVTAAGAASVTVPAGQPLTITQTGGGSLTLGADGSGTLSAGGSNIILTAGGAVNITPAGVVTVGTGTAHAVQTTSGPSTKLFAV